MGTLHRKKPNDTLATLTSPLLLEPKCQDSGIGVDGGASQRLLQRRLIIDDVEISMAHSFIGSEAFLAQFSNRTNLNKSSSSLGGRILKVRPGNQAPHCWQISCSRYSQKLLQGFFSK